MIMAGISESQRSDTLSEEVGRSCVSQTERMESTKGSRLSLTCWKNLASQSDWRWVIMKKVKAGKIREKKGRI